MGIRDHQQQRLKKSLNELEGWAPHDEEAPTQMVAKCWKLLKRPIGELTPGELRLLIGQNLGSMFLVPLAMDLLANDPFLDTILYPGDLLQAVITLPESFWQQQSALKRRLDDVVNSIHDYPDDELLVAEVEQYRSK